MANLLSWASHKIKDAEHAVGNAVHGAEHAAVQGANTLSNVANRTAQISNKYVAPNTPVVKEIVQHLPEAVNNPLKAAVGVGRDVINQELYHPVAQGVADVAATGLRRNINLPGGVNAAPVDRQIAAAQGTKNKLLTGLGIAGDVASILPAAEVARGASRIGVNATKAASREVAAGLPQLQNEAGYIGGPNAKSFPDKVAQDKVQGNSFETSDQGLKIKGKGANKAQAGQTVPLGDVIKHPQLQNDYPDLFDKQNGLKVAFDPKALQSTIDHDTGIITLAKSQVGDIKSAAGRTRITEEIQHAIDAKEGRSSGTTPEFEKVRNVPQEYKDALRTTSVLEPEVQNLKALRNRGNITDIEYNQHPSVRRYNSLKQQIKGAKIQNGSSTKVYHGTSDDVGDLKAGSAVGRGENRNLLYATEDPKFAAEYAKSRTKMLGKSGEGKVKELNLRGRILRQGDYDTLEALTKTPEFKNLPGRTQNIVTNISSPRYGEITTEQIDAHPELAKFLSDHGIAGVEASHSHYEGFNRPKQIVITDHKYIQPEMPSPLSHDQALESYLANEGEQRAKTVAERSGLNQKQIDQNPLGLPYVDQALGIQPRVAASADAAKVADNKFTQSVQNSPEFSSAVRAGVSGQHGVRDTAQLVRDVNQRIDTDGLDKSAAIAQKELSVPDGQASDETLAHAIEVARHHDALGTAEGHDMAVSLLDQVAQHGVAKGQGIQILAMIAKSTPEGMRNLAFRTLEKNGVEVTPAIKKEIQDHIDAIKSLPEGEAKNFAIAVLQKAVAKHLPQGKLNGAVSVWKAGLLSGTKTQGGNLVSNATFAGLKSASDPLATLIDKGIALKTGERTKALTGRGAISGANDGRKNAWTTLRTGIDKRNLDGQIDKYENHAEINFKNKLIQNIFGKPSNLVFRGMNAADQPFYYGAFKNSLYDRAKADGLTKGLKGSQLKDHMDNLVANPTEKLVNTAEAEANKSVLGYDTYASKFIQGAKKGIDNAPFSDAGKQVAHGVVDLLAPFSKVPSAFLSRTIDFTPFGVGKTIFSQVYNKKFNQRMISQAISEGITGTGLVALGMQLSHSNMLSGDYPKNDPKEQARWKAEGITPNSVKLGGKWVSLNYLGPVGLLFNAGHKMVDSAQGGGGKIAQGASALAGIGQGLLGQSFLQGFSGFSDAINDPARNAASYLKSEAASLVPNLSNDAANITDSMQRQSNSAIDSVKAKIPGLRETLPVKKDAFGNPLAQAAGGINAAVNPLKPSNDLSNSLTQEIDRLKNTGKENFVIPTPDKTIQVGGQTVKLTPQQQDAYNTAIGQLTQKTWNDIIATPEYGKLDDAKKADALRSALTDISAVAKVQTLDAIGQGDLAKKANDGLTNNQYDMLTGATFKPSDYAVTASLKDDSSGGSTRGSKDDPQKSYSDALTKYTRDKDKMSATDRFTAEKNLRTLSIQKDYSQDAIDMYKLSKGDLQDFLAANPDKSSLVNQVLGLDQKLADAKGTKTKFGGTVASKAKGGSKKTSKAKVATYSSSNTAHINKLLRGSTVKAPKVTVRKPKLAKVKLPKTRHIA